ncbi:MAG: hypothetical protein ACE5IP_11945 [Terriglobia bacterium]
MQRTSISKPRRPRKYPLRCPRCHDRDHIDVIKESGTKNPAAAPKWKLRCATCAAEWWSIHRDVVAAVQRFLERHGQRRLFPLDNT